MSSDAGATSDETSRVTLAPYEQGAEQWLGTHDHDLSPNIDALLTAPALQAGPRVATGFSDLPSEWFDT